MSEQGTDMFWHGSVLVVTKPGEQKPTLELKSLGAWDKSGKVKSSPTQTVEGLKLYQDPGKAFWRFSVQLPLAEAEAQWQYTIPNMRFLSDVSKESSRVFVVPAVTESMRIMFHSCNGFSVGTDEDFWSGEFRLACRSVLSSARPNKLLYKALCCGMRSCGFTMRNPSMS